MTDMKTTAKTCLLAEVTFILLTGSIGLSAGFNIINGSTRPEMQMNPCLLSIKDACFWKLAEFHVSENRNMVLLGRPGPEDTCKLGLKYRLINGTELVILKHQDKYHWFLYSHPYLDREEEKTDNSIFEMSCTDGYQTATQHFSLRVFDEDDNPPVNLQNWFDESSLLAMDLDSPSVNNYTATLPKMYSDIFNMELHLKEIHVSNAVATGIYCDVSAKNDYQYNQSEYYTTVLLNDTSLLASYGPRELEVPVKLRVLQPDTVSCERDIGLPRLAQKSIIQYQTSQIVLSNSAAPFTRLAQPLNSRKTLRGYNFSLNLIADHLKAFDITPTNGIIFLRNVSLLVHPFNSTVLEVLWEHENKTNGSAKLKVVIEDKVACRLHSQLDEWSTCSESPNRKNCTNTCGLGTGTISRVNSSDGVPGGCRWLEPLIGNSAYRTYSTCVPDPDTCPDGWCDPLEQLHNRLCPQDCSDSIMIPATTRENGRGIKTGVGVCTCDPFGICTCLPNEAYRSSSKKSQTQSVPMSQSQNSGQKIRGPECGSACLAGVVAGSLSVTAAIATLFILCRTRLLTKTEQRNRKLGNSQAPLRSTDTLLTIEPVQTPTEHNADNTMIDTKWEFPRDHLEVESCLGEGEFGRVLRARANNIAGIPGITTVAVKTLKDNAGPAELADLMSEYQMLKEISHPNVIRLLGASTTPGGPIYLIIEFAHHGSLKSYLRRHRPLEGRRSQENEPQVEQIKPRDILSFSWQISKGMEYLSEMKLVHRDLAARNILVASGKVCKVSDFGLTRDIYEDDTYLKRSKGRVPVKWMALESLADHIYTSKSDIWSFGILLWELITLGSSPYPGVAVHNLFYLLRAGYRMEKPENCSHQLYDIMRSCWQEDPMERPSFKQLTRTFEVMLEDGTDYLDLTARFVHNRTYFTDLPDQGNALPEESPSDNEEPLPIVGEKIANFKHTAEHNNHKLTASVNISNATAHYVNEKVTLEGYESPKNNNLNRFQNNLSYVNVTEGHTDSNSKG